MKTKKVVGVICIALIVVVIVFLTRCSEELMKSESSKQLAEQKNQTVVAENNSPTSAIARAKMLSERKSFRDEAYQLFGISVWSHQEDIYLQFRERLFANSQFNSALRNAKKEDVRVFLDNKFKVGTGYVGINIDSTNEKIIEFLSSSLAVAKAKQAEFESLRKEASQYGLTLSVSKEAEYYKQIKGRLAADKNLVAALRAAAKVGVVVFPKREFGIGRGYLLINVNATNEEIIKFLLGK